MTIAGRVAGLLLMLLTVSGCVVSRTGDPEGPDAPAPRREAPPSAADGSDVTACTDGNCEIRLEDTMDIPLPGGNLAITVTDDDKIEYTVTVNGSTTSGSAKGNCVSVFDLDGTGGGSTCYAGGAPAPAPRPRPGQVAMVVVGQDTDAPVLRLTTG